MDYIKDVFLGQIHADHGDTLNEASLLLDSWKAITDLEVLRDHKANKPLLQVRLEWLSPISVSVSDGSVV